MPYKISTKPLPLNKSFSSAENKVYSICHNPLTIQEILDHLQLILNQKQIIKALDDLVLKGFIEITDATEIQYKKAQSLAESSIEIPSSKTNESLFELYSKLKEVLINNLPVEEAQLYIDELKICPDVDSLKYKARRIALKLELMVSSQIGKALRLQLKVGDTIQA